MPKGVEVALEDDEHDHVLPGGLRIGLGRCAVGSPRRAVHGDLGGRRGRDEREENKDGYGGGDGR